MNWFNNIIKKLERPVEENPIDKAIVEKLPQNGEVNKVYEARWVWYHTILAIEIAFTNILLLLILFVLAFK
jgi:hypothetical protein